MRKSFLVLLASIVFLTACNDTKSLSDNNFKQTINQYLARHGRTCIWIGRPFPVEISEVEQKLRYDTSSQMASLEQAGQVRSSDAVAVVPGIFGSGTPRYVKRYEPTDEGRKYLQQVPGVFGQSAGFCYGDKTVDSIVKWTEPAATGVYLQTEVTYIYKIANLAPWAERSDVQREFNDVRTTLNGISKSNEIARLQLTNQGWEVPSR